MAFLLLGAILGPASMRWATLRPAIAPANRALAVLPHVALHRDLDMPFERAQIELRAGIALAASGERELAVEQLTSAYRVARRLAARPLAAEAAREVSALGESVSRRLGVRAAAHAHGAGLSRRELEVVRLLAVGRTNREIAHELYLSTRTVDMPVRNILRKLDSRSRVEAAHRAGELGLSLVDTLPTLGDQPWVWRRSGELQAGVYLLSDANLDHFGSSAWDSGRTVLYRDGEPILESEEPGFAFAEQLPPGGRSRSRWSCSPSPERRACRSASPPSRRRSTAARPGRGRR
jgi:DNA-binding NarL/FixJ family response regulator